MPSKTSFSWIEYLGFFCQREPRTSIPAVWTEFGGACALVLSVMRVRKPGRPFEHTTFLNNGITFQGRVGSAAVSFFSAIDKFAIRPSGHIPPLVERTDH